MGWFRLVVVLAAFAMGYVAATWRHAKGISDFACFWIAAQNSHDPYNIAWIQHYAGFDVTSLPFAYPPVLLILVYPFGLLPIDIAYPLWSGLGFGLLAFAATFVARLGAPLILFNIPTIIAASLGQTSLLIGALMIGGMAALESRPKLSGALLALAACIKPQAMLAAPIVLWGRWEAVRSAIVTSVALVAVSMVFGPARWVEWYHAATDFPVWFEIVRLVAPQGLFDHLAWRLAMIGLGVMLALRGGLLGLAGGSLCLTPYAQAYDLTALAVLGAAWMGRWKEVGIAPAILGAALVFTMIQTSMTTTLLLVAAAALPFLPRGATKPELRTAF